MGEATKGRSMLPFIVGGVLVVVAVVGIVFMTTRGGGQTITGTFSLYDSDVSSDCSGSGGYDDIQPGAAVTVRNQTGETIATGNIGSGEYFESVGCEYDFSVEGVPDAAFYRIEVSHRGEVEFSRAEMESQDWKVQLSLGE
jgi:hypothetical protein